MSSKVLALAVTLAAIGTLAAIFWAARLVEWDF